MVLVSQTFSMENYLVCHVPGSAEKLEPLKVANEQSKYLEMEWNPGVYESEPVIVCTLANGEHSVELVFRPSCWEDLKSTYYFFLIHWGNDLADDSKSLILPMDTFSFYHFLKTCFVNLQQNDLPVTQKTTLFQIISSFFQIEIGDFHGLVH